MAISDKLTYLSGTKDRLKTTINYAGAGLTNETFRQYPEKLYDKYLDILKDNGEALFNGLPKATGTGTSLSLNGTANTRMKMNLAPSELEQTTTTGKNLLKTVLPSTTSQHGLTLTQNSDGTFTVNGTSSSSGRFNITSTSDKLYFTLGELGFTQGETGKLSGCPAGGNASTPTTSYKLFMSGGSGASNVNDGGSGGISDDGGSGGVSEVGGSGGVSDECS